MLSIGSGNITLLRMLARQSKHGQSPHEARKHTDSRHPSPRSTDDQPTLPPRTQDAPTFRDRLRLVRREAKQRLLQQAHEPHLETHDAPSFGGTVDRHHTQVLDTPLSTHDGAAFALKESYSTQDGSITSQGLLHGVGTYDPECDCRDCLRFGKTALRGTAKASVQERGDCDAERGSLAGGCGTPIPHVEDSNVISRLDAIESVLRSMTTHVSQVIDPDAIRIATAEAVRRLDGLESIGAMQQIDSKLRALLTDTRSEIHDLSREQIRVIAGQIEDLRQYLVATAEEQASTLHDQIAQSDRVRQTLLENVDLMDPDLLNSHSIWADDMEQREPQRPSTNQSDGDETNGRSTETTHATDGNARLVNTPVLQVQGATKGVAANSAFAEHISTPTHDKSEAPAAAERRNIDSGDSREEISHLKQTHPDPQSPVRSVTLTSGEPRTPHVSESDGVTITGARSGKGSQGQAGERTAASKPSMNWGWPVKKEHTPVKPDVQVAAAAPDSTPSGVDADAKPRPKCVYCNRSIGLLYSGGRWTCKDHRHVRCTPEQFRAQKKEWAAGKNAKTSTHRRM